MLNTQRAAVLLILGCVAAVAAYFPGLFGPFVFDDIPNIILNTRLVLRDWRPESILQAALSMPSGPLMRPISMASFALNQYAFGLAPFSFKLTNLAIHLAGGIGVYALTVLTINATRLHFESKLTSKHVQWVSAVVAVGWLLHPLNLTSVLYVVQRMTSLSALFCFWGLALFVWGRMKLARGSDGRIALLASLLIFTSLAALSKENGALLPLLMLVVEVTLFRFAAGTESGRKFVVMFFAVGVAVPLAVGLLYVAFQLEAVTSGYANREFSLHERLMTESRVLWFYLRQIVIPNTSQMGLFHDDIEVSRTLLSPPTTLAAIFGMFALLAAVVLTRRSAPFVSFGLAFFLVGHAMESTVLPLEIAHEHRNYLPMYGIILVVFYHLLSPAVSVRSLRLRQVGALAILGVLAFGTFARANQWSNVLDLATTEVQNHPRSVRANNGMGSIYANLVTDDPVADERNYASARQHFEAAIGLNPRATQGLFSLVALTSKRGKQVEPLWVEELKRRLASGPVEADMGDKFQSLVRCQEHGGCSLGRDQIEGLFKSVLGNPVLSSRIQAAVLRSLSYYYVNILKDYPKALATMHQMVEASPNEPEYRLTLIKFMVALGMREEARSQIDLVTGTDQWGLYRSEVQSLLVSLAKIEQSSLRER